MNYVKVEKEEIAPFLIVCPSSIIDNWLRELNVWGYFAVGKFHGVKEREEVKKKLKNKRLEVVLTTHETCRDHLDELNAFEWSAVIVDEFHKIKNDKSQTTQKFKEFKPKVRIGLSGTLVQNDLIEFWTLLDWYK